LIDVNPGTGNAATPISELILIKVADALAISLSLMRSPC